MLGRALHEVDNAPVGAAGKQDALACLIYDQALLVRKGVGHIIVPNPLEQVFSAFGQTVASGHVGKQQ